MFGRARTWVAATETAVHELLASTDADLLVRGDPEPDPVARRAGPYPHVVVGFRFASQRVMARAAEELAADRTTWFISLGSSTTPAIRVVQRVALRPAHHGESLVGRIVLAEIRGRFWLHRVSDERADQVHIVADNGMVNGWTPRTAVFGVLTA